MVKSSLVSTQSWEPPWPRTCRSTRSIGSDCKSGGEEISPRIPLVAASYSLNVADWRVVKSLNSLTDAVSLVAGDNVTIVPAGNTLTISSVGGGDSDWTVAGNDMLAAVTGNVGIGTASPGEKLEVNGNLKLTGGSTGTGKVLTSGADGLASWEPITAEYMISPTHAFIKGTVTDCVIFHMYAHIEINREGGLTSAGVYIPVDAPAKLSGVHQKLLRIEINYRCVDAGSYIGETNLSRCDDDGTWTDLIHSTLHLDNKSWTGHVFTDPSPKEITGALVLRLNLSFAGTGPAHALYIGSIVITTTT